MGFLDNILNRAGKFLREMVEEASAEASDPAIARLRARKTALIELESRLRSERELSMGMGCLSSAGLLVSGILALLTAGHWSMVTLMLGLTAVGGYQLRSAFQATRKMVVVKTQVRAVSRELAQRRKAHQKLLEDRSAERVKARLDRLMDFVLDESDLDGQLVNEYAQESILSLADEEIPPLLQERARLRRHLLRTDPAGTEAEVDRLAQRLGEATDLKECKRLESRLEAEEEKHRDLERFTKRLRELDEELATLDAHLENLETKLVVEGCRDLDRIRPIVDALEAYRQARKLPEGLTGELAMLEAEEDDEDLPGLLP